MSAAPAVSRLVAEVARVSREHPHDRKLLVCQSLAQGRELLRAAALAGFPWLGWEVSTPRGLAHDLVVLELARAGEKRADDFDLMAAADAAIDAVEERDEAGPFGGTTGNSGYRDAIRRTLETLRAGGVKPDQLWSARFGDAKLQVLAAMLAELERQLRERHLIDGPAVMQRATRALEEGRASLPEGSIFVLPGQSFRGVGGRFLRALLRSKRVRLLATDSVLGIPAPPGAAWTAPDDPTGPLSALHAPMSGAERPDLALFAAATPTDELREVLRRVVTAGIPWDRVEILTTDPVTYGAALDALARRLDIPVTYARGLDSRRTRAGRAVEAYLRWLGEDFPAEVMRGMLESGDLAPPPGFEDVSGAALARRLRRLRIGWGRERYLAVIDQAIASAEGTPEIVDDVDPAQVELWRKRERRELAALRALLADLLAATPDPAAATRRRAGPPLARTARSAEGRTSPAAIASGVLTFLGLVPSSAGIAEGTMRKVLGDRLGRIRDTLIRSTAWDAAIAVLRASLVTRIAPDGERGLAPWISTGGHLYLSDLTTGGFSLRPHVFVVGMDAARVAGASGSDPLLTDADRQAIASVTADRIPPIATSGDRISEARHALAATLARLRGSITLSYSAWESAEGSSVSPAPELLQALRLRQGDEALTYAELRLAMGSLTGAVPTCSRLLDGDDVWLDAIADGRVLRSGTGVVRSVFAGLDAGLHARDARRSAEVTVYDGVITPRSELDPLAAEAVFSASRLETLGTCPRRYFYHYVLGIVPVSDPEFDPDVWLDAMRRGSLLHAVYESTLTEARRRGIDYAEVTFADLAQEALEAEAERALRETPPPSQAVYDRELADLVGEVLTWVEMVRQERPSWVEVELRFGPGEREARIAAAGGQIRVRGAIDRVDRLPNGGLRIVDYKTGSFSRYRQRQPFAGGRRIQHVLYTLAAEQLLGEPVNVMEYHFPTRKGQMRRISYGDEALQRGATVLRTLLGMASSGHFVTTDECKDCLYCDFAAVCRVQVGGFNHVTSERATWSKDIGMELPEYARLAALRDIDD